MGEQRLYDKPNHRLIYLVQKATPEFWDRLWNESQLLEQLENSTDRWLLRITKKYLPNTSCRILEGGCGTGGKVYTLQQAGYATTGIDFAKNTIAAIKQAMPDLNVQLGDVRRLDFPDESFEGYWSLGVIEHFWTGYDDILSEMYRVLTPGGYLFLTVPQLSPWRRYQATRGHYPLFSPEPDNHEPEGFYQFAIPPRTIIKDLQKAGFTVLHHRGVDGLRGVLNDVRWLTGCVRPIVEPRTFVAKVLKKTLNPICSPLLGHICLYIARKPSSMRNDEATL